MYPFGNEATPNFNCVISKKQCVVKFLSCSLIWTLKTWWNWFCLITSTPVIWHEIWQSHVKEPERLCGTCYPLAVLNEISEICWKRHKNLWQSATQIPEKLHVAVTQNLFWDFLRRWCVRKKIFQRTYLCYNMFCMLGMLFNLTMHWYQLRKHVPPILHALSHEIVRFRQISCQIRGFEVVRQNQFCQVLRAQIGEKLRNFTTFFVILPVLGCLVWV